MNMLNRIFTPGPVPIDEHILSIGAQQPPYNRTGEFSHFTHEILSNLKHLFQTDGEVAVLTGSGTLQHKLNRVSRMGDQNSSDIDFNAASLAGIVIPKPVERIT